jgi:hypothetical protein
VSEQAELAALRARISELEAELVEVHAWAAREVAEAQESLYWLERWGVDLNEWMAHPMAPRLRAAFRLVRDVKRRLAHWWRLATR